MNKSIRLMNQFPTKQVTAWPGLLVAAALLITGCGKQAFEVGQIQHNTQGSGFFEIPAKVDILFAQDDSGSISTSYSVINSQMRSFLDGIEARGWDYHFAVTPITTSRNITQVAASRYDTNWGSLWLPPYPGATPGMISGNISASAFRTAANVPGFPQFDGFVNPTFNSQEPGFRSVWNTLNSSSARNSGFLRDDAMLIVFLLSNGEDTTGYTRDSNGHCNGQCAIDYENSLNNYRNAFAGLKPNPTLVKWYSAVAQYVSAFGGGPCINGNSFKGTRYMRMASELGGASFDICRQPIGDAIEAFAGYLQNIRLSYVTRYIFVTHEPDPDRDMSVVKTSGGVSYELPESLVNGWTYEGYVENVPTLEIPSPSGAPIQMAPASGYAFRLNGSAALLGDDTAVVRYYQMGAQNSVAE
jgi:hypothetical protein